MTLIHSSVQQREGLFIYSFVIRVQRATEVCLTLTIMQILKQHYWAWESKAMTRRGKYAQSLLLMLRLLLPQLTP